MSTQIKSIAGPEKGCVVTIVGHAGPSRMKHSCPVCSRDTYLSEAVEESTGRHFCTEHWAVLRYNTQTTSNHQHATNHHQ